MVSVPLQIKETTNKQTDRLTCEISSVEINPGVDVMKSVES